MSSKEIPAHVRQLIARHVGTVKDLEVLVLLAESTRAWTAEAIGSALYFSTDAALSILEMLTSAGLAVRLDSDPAEYRYNASGGLDTSVRELAALYREMRVRVIETIYAPPDDPLQNFADSFIIKKDKDRE